MDVPHGVPDFLSLFDFFVNAPAQLSSEALWRGECAQTKQLPSAER